MLLPEREEFQGIFGSGESRVPLPTTYPLRNLTCDGI
jgi:hypothetical protein